MRIVQVDAFTDRPFSGNPAAVCVLPEPADVAWMQSVALEMNLSETAFLVAGDDGYDLRWFTPTVEVDLCGHATLASAHVLFEDGHSKSDETLRFQTRSGLLTARRDGEWIELDFPARTMSDGAIPREILDAIGGTPVAEVTGEVAGGFEGYMLEYATESEVRALAPDFGALSRHPNGYAIVTAPADADDVDFVSRFFAPPAGIDEDPVTGAAHCALGPWWGAKFGKDTLVGYQCSARGGTVRVTLAGDRVLLGGQAVTVLRGDLV